MRWVKQPEIYEAGPVGGDYQVSDGWNVRYTLQDGPDDGLHAIIDENFYVESGPDGASPYVVTTQTMYQVCTDPEDPGGTEVYADYEYDEDDDITLYFDSDGLARAIASTRRLAELDRSDMFLWDGRTNIRHGRMAPREVET